jgi:uncharacterized membrane protein YebE (DUF533 family)
MKTSRAAQLLVIVVLAGAAGGGVMLMGGQNSAARIDEIRGPAGQLVASADIYKSESAYVEGLFGHAHPVAAAAVGSGFTPEKYYTALFQAMVDKAKADGKEDVARSLRTFAVGKGYIGVKF